MADTGERLAVVEIKVEATIDGLQKHLADCAIARKELNERLRQIERVIFLATGAGIAVSALIKYLLAL